MKAPKVKARPRSRPQLGESWVVEHDSDSSSDTASDMGVELDGKERLSAKQPELTKEEPRHRSSRTASKASADPELIMPSIHEDSLDGSWYSGEQPRVRRSPRKKSQAQGPDSTSKRQDRETEQNRTQPQKGPWNTIELAINLTQPIMRWLYEVMGGAMGTLKPFLSLILAVYLFIGLLLVLKNLFTTSVYSALSPLCRIPGSSLLNLPMCHTSISQYTANSGNPVEFDQLINVQNRFDTILEESAGGVTLPLDMKRSETSIRDLRTIIRYSSLPSKNELVYEFNGFIETAGIASSDLQKFNSHVGRGVDNILATARWTKRVLDGVAEDHSSRGLIPSFITNSILAPFQPIPFTEATVLQQYTAHTRAVEGEINHLIDEAQALLMVLRNLDDRLDVIHGISVRDNLHAQGSKEETMSYLWTMLGGNRKELGKYNSQIKLLGQVNMYRQSAIAHVAGTMLRLQAMGAELEELRERVGTVELIGGRKGGVPLSVHIEAIEMGVERLEERRNWARGLENERLRKALDRNDGKGGTKEIEGR
ncbi:MAG: hypothetical protein Q9212_001654 [Teloschistes hypoglaucus]